MLIRIQEMPIYGGSFLEMVLEELELQETMIHVTRNNLVRLLILVPLSVKPLQL